MDISQIIADSRFDKEPSQISLFDALKYILGGEAVVTIFPIKQNRKFVYKCSQLVTYEKSKPIKHNRFFLSVLTGSDNTKDYTYIGTIDKKESKNTNIYTLRLTEKSGMSATAPSYMLFDTLLYNLQCVPEHIATLINRIKVYHDGTCSKCGRPLTDIVSTALGQGPICYPEAHKAYKLECKIRGIILPKKSK